MPTRAKAQRPGNTIEVAHAFAPEPIEIHRGFAVTRPHPRHWHEEYHLCAVTGGDGYLETRGVSHFTPVNTLFIVPPGEVHANHTDPSGQGCTYKNIYVPAVLVERAASQAGADRVPDFPVLADRKDLVAGFLEMVRILEHADSKLHCEAAVLMFFTMLVRVAGDCGRKPVSCARDANAVKIAREFLDENYDREIGLDKLSRLTNISPYHLNRIFRRELGIPPHAYQIQLRIARAKSLLRQRRPLAEVALQTGFSDQSHFTRHFKRMVGVTPGAFSPESKNVQDRLAVGS